MVQLPSFSTTDTKLLWQMQMFSSANKRWEEKVHRKQERAIILHLLRNSAPFPFILEANGGNSFKLQGVINL